MSSRLPVANAAKSVKPIRFRHSVGNELFEKMDFAESCRLARRFGYTGFEIAPFTLAENVDDLAPTRRRELSRIMRSEGITFVGLHWMLMTPKWLHVTTADKAERERSWQYFRKLIDFAGDLSLGQPSILVLGSPKQRASRGSTPQEATKYLAEGLASVAAHAKSRKATIGLEPIGSTVTDVVNTVADAVAVAKQVNHPAVKCIFDYKHIGNETEPSEVIVRKHYDFIRHIHIKELDGRHPGTGAHDFLPVLRVLADKRYKGWVSLEVDDFKAGAETICRESMEHMRKLEARLSATG